jgi:histidine triad (HIT) family protein
LHLAAAQLAQKLNIAESGYRTVFNCNADAGQAVFHIHGASAGRACNGMAAWVT